MARVVIAAGGTAGHVVPALAVADALRDRGTIVSFLGAKGRAEAALVPAAGYEIDLLDVGPLDRRNPLRASAAAARALRAVPTARRLLRARGAGVVMGGGGYVSGPAGMAAAIGRLPLVLTEADSRLGLANRLLASRAHRICLSFPIPGREPPRYLVTGRPVPRAVLTADRAAARARFGVGDEPCLLVFGGSQGARTLNLAVAEAFAGDGRERPFHLVHITGRRDFEDVARSLGPTKPERCTLIDQEPDLGDALAAADLVVARSGGSIFEIAAAGKPAILVPYPHASGDHQSANARWMEAAGAARVIPDSDLDPDTLAQGVRELLSNTELLAAMSRASAALARPDAAERIAEEVLGAAAG